jgi:hypothetical protein
MNESRNTRPLEIAIRRLAGVFGDDADRSHALASIGPDAVFRVRGPDNRLIVAEVVERPSRPAVLDAWREVRAYAQETAGAIPVVVLPQLTRSLRQVASELGLNWVDFAGNAEIDAAPIYVRIHGQRQQTPQRSPRLNPFSGRSLNLVRVLLVHSDRRWRQKELVAASGLSQPRSSKVLSALEDQGLVAREGDGTFRVVDVEGLLDAWSDSYRYDRQDIVRVHATGDGIKLARELGDRLDELDVTHWFTGLPAAWAYTHFARFRLVSVFVSADPEIIAEDLRLRPTDRGENIHLLAAAEQRLEIGHARPDGIRCVHPTQVYVDLLGLPERAPEAAARLREAVFDPRNK